MSRRKEVPVRAPYDPATYQAELDAKCARVGSAWMPSRVGRDQILHGSERDEIRDTRLKLKLLAEPEIADELPKRVLPAEGV